MQPTSLGSDHFGSEPAEDESEPTQLCSAVPHYGGQAVVFVPVAAEDEYEPSAVSSHYGGQAAVSVPKPASTRPSYYGGQAAVFVPEAAEDESEPSAVPSHYGGQAAVFVPEAAEDESEPSAVPSHYGGQAAVFVSEAAEDGVSEPSAVPSHYGGQAAVSVRLDDGLAADLKRTAQQYLRQAKGLDIILVMETTGRMQVAA